MRRNFVLILLLLSTLATGSVVAPGSKTGKGGSSPLTTKGDVYTFGTSDCRLPVAANGQILTTDSAQSCGLKWAPAGAGTGNVTDINGDATGSQTLTVGTTGSDFAIVDNASGDHKFNLPDASATKRGVISTGNQVVGAGTKTFDSLAISTTGDSLTITGGGGGAGIIKFDNAAASGKYNWLLGGQYNQNNSFEITPSTATDGNTFSTPVFKVTQAGVGSLTGVVNAAGFYGLTTPLASSGTIRLANTDSIGFRDSTNAVNHTISMEGSTLERFNFSNAIQMTRSFNGGLRTVVNNANAGSSAFSELTLSSDADDLNIFADSTAGGADTGITSGSGFTAGMVVKANAGPVKIRTSGGIAIQANADLTLQLPAYGSGVLTSDGSGNITSTAAGTGNVAGQASSVDSEIALFSGTGGKTIKRATGTGFVKATSGVYSTSTIAGSDLPNPSSSTLGGVQSIASASHNFLTTISTSGVPSKAQPVFADLADMTGFVEQMTGFILTAANQAYTLDESAAYAYTINTIIIESSAGTVTADLKIAGTDVTGCSAVSVSSTPATGTCSAANAVSIGNKVTMTLSSNSAALNVGFTVKTTR